MLGIMTTPPTLEQQICFALYSASRAFTRYYRELLEPLGLSYPQYLVLLALWEDETATVSQLGARLQLDSGTLSPLLRRLERAGHVHRARSPSDERAVIVTLTDAGRELHRLTAGIPDSICAATGLELEELAALQRQVARLGARVSESA